MATTGTSNRSTLVGVFNNAAEAQAAVRDLRHAGFREDQIGVISPGEGHTKASATDSKVAEGAAVGAATGAGVGALWALGIAAGMLPAIGPVIAGGLLMSVIASAGGAAAVGTVLGGLIGLGVPEHEAKYYEGEFKAGRTLVTVKADGRRDEAWTILSRHGAYDVKTRANTSTTAGAAVRSEGGQTIQVREEELHARKTPVQTGEVRVRKEVHTEQKSIQVPVEREEVVVERRPASGRASGDIHEGQEIRIPITDEQVRLEKTPVVKEEVHIGKRKVSDTEQVSGTVRKEEVHIEREGKAGTRNRTGGK